MAERSTLFSASQSSVRTLWKNWLPADAVVMARRSAPVAESIPLVAVVDPWATQDPLARPLLDRMIQAMGLAPEKVVVMEIGEADFQNRLLSHNPRSVVTLGAAAAQALLGEAFSWESQHGHWQTHQGLKVMPTLDLQTLLKNPAAKKDAWADLQKVMKSLAES